MGEEGNDRVQGDGGNDYVDGFEGNDVLHGDTPGQARGGDDEIYGGDGSDQVFGDGGDDRVTGNGSDRVSGTGRRQELEEAPTSSTAAPARTGLIPDDDSTPDTYRGGAGIDTAKLPLLRRTR